MTHARQNRIYKNTAKKFLTIDKLWNIRQLLIIYPFSKKLQKVQQQDFSKFT